MNLLQIDTNKPTSPVSRAVDTPAETTKGGRKVVRTALTSLLTTKAQIIVVSDVVKPSAVTYLIDLDDLVIATKTPTEIWRLEDIGDIVKVSKV